MTKFKEMLKKWREAFKAMLRAAKEKAGFTVKQVMRVMRSLLKRIMQLFRKNKEENIDNEEVPVVEEKKTLKEKVHEKVDGLKEKAVNKVRPFLEKYSSQIDSWGPLVAFIPQIALTIWAIFRHSVIDSLVGLCASVGINMLFEKLFAMYRREAANFECTQTADPERVQKAMRDPEFKAVWETIEKFEEKPCEAYSKIPEDSWKVLRGLDKYANVLRIATGVIVFGVSVATGTGIDSAVRNFAISMAAFQVIGRTAQLVINGICSMRMCSELNGLMDAFNNGIEPACKRVDAAAEARYRERQEELRRAKYGKKDK